MARKNLRNKHRTWLCTHPISWPIRVPGPRQLPAARFENVRAARPVDHSRPPEPDASEAMLVDVGALTIASVKAVGSIAIMALGVLDLMALERASKDQEKKGDSRDSILMIMFENARSPTIFLERSRFGNFSCIFLRFLVVIQPNAFIV